MRKETGSAQKLKQATSCLHDTACERSDKARRSAFAGVEVVIGNTKNALVERGDRKSTRLNSSHVSISYAVFCLKKKKQNNTITVCVGNEGAKDDPNVPSFCVFKGMLVKADTFRLRTRVTRGILHVLPLAIVTSG